MHIVPFALIHFHLVPLNINLSDSLSLPFLCSSSLHVRTKYPCINMFTFLNNVFAAVSLES